MHSDYNELTNANTDDADDDYDVDCWLYWVVLKIIQRRPEASGHCSGCFKMAIVANGCFSMV